MQKQRAGHGAPPGGRTPVTRLGVCCGGSAGMSVYLRACTVSCVCSRVYIGVVRVYHGSTVLRMCAVGLQCVTRVFHLSRAWGACI